MPVHSGQAPNGLLNENERGSTSSIASGWSLGQAIFSENRRSRSGSLASRSTNSTTSTPPASPSAVSTESVSRRLDAGSSPLATSRSTTTSMVCLSCFSSLGGSVSDDDLAVDAGPGEALGLQLGEQVDVLALAAPHDGREHLEAGALGQLEQPVDDLLRASAG